MAAPFSLAIFRCATKNRFFVLRCIRFATQNDYVSSLSPLSIIRRELTNIGAN